MWAARPIQIDSIVVPIAAPIAVPAQGATDENLTIAGVTSEDRVLSWWIAGMPDTVILAFGTGAAGQMIMRWVNFGAAPASVPAGDLINLHGTGLFEMASAMTGNPAYGNTLVSRPTLDLQEWLR
jgi:hypothetical protein